MKRYYIIFHDNYDFNHTAQTLKYVIERVGELIFMLYYKEPDVIKPILITKEEHARIFNNVTNITLRESNEVIEDNFEYKALLKLKRHYAIPITDRLEPLALYRILADYRYAETEEADAGIFAFHIRRADSRYPISLYYKKHEKARDSVFYAYGDLIKRKMQARHYLASILIASNTSILFNEILVALKDMAIRKRLNSSILNRHDSIREIILKKPSKPLFANKYPILADFEVVSLMLPDSISNMRVLTDGVKPYTNGDMV